MKNPSATPKPVPSAPPRTKMAIPRQSLFMGSVSCVWCWVVGGCLEVEREERGDAQRERDSGDAGRPADPVEGLTEDRRADEAAGEVTGEIDAAGRAAIRGGGAADKSGRCRLREERPDADQDHAEQDCHELGRQQQRQAETRQRERTP